MIHETCFVIRKRPYSETSLILEMLTGESRYVHAIYRGAKRNGSTPIDLFTKYAMSWRPRSGLLTVRSCEALRPLHLARSALYAGLYLNELVYRGMYEQQVIDGVRTAYEEALLDLEKESKDQESALRTFEQLYLKALGFQIQFHLEQANDREISLNYNYCFNPSIGFQRTTEKSPHNYPGHVLLDIAAHQYDKLETRQAAKSILRDALDYHLSGSSLHARALLTAKAYRVTADE